MRSVVHMSSMHGHGLLLRPLAACLLVLLAGVDPIEGSTASVAADATSGVAAQTNAAAATTVVVQNCNDSGPGSLREAYLQAGDGITLDLTQLTCSLITLTTGALSDAGGAAESGSGGITLNGSGQTIDAGGRDRAIVHNGTDALTLHGLRVINGAYNSSGRGGGCVYSNGSVMLDASTVSSCTLTGSGGGNVFGGAVYSKQKVILAKDSIVSNSTAKATKYGFAQGGGIWAHGVFLDHSIVSGNSAVGDKNGGRGGGVFATYSAGYNGAFAMTFSTVAYNSANRGGGIYVYGDGSAENSTISGNSAGGDGGGIYLRANPHYTFRHSGFIRSTISGNRADTGGGLSLDSDAGFTQSTIANNYAYASGGGAYLRNFSHYLSSTIFATNGAHLAPGSGDIGGLNAQLAGYYNLIVASTITVPDDTLSDDPQLGPLQDNGGPTFTHALLAGSPAIDAGYSNPMFDHYDQRGPGFARTIGSSADIGAFERQDILFQSGFEAGP